MLAVDADGGFWTFFLSSIISLFFLPLSVRQPDTDLKYYLKGSLNPKQPTNLIYRILLYSKGN